MTSALCTVNGLSTLNGYVDVTANNVHTVALADPAGANTWTLVCISTDDTHTTAAINATVSINSVSKTATFTSFTGLSSAIFESVVNSGQDQNGRVVAGYTSRFKVCVPEQNLRLACVDETIEHDTTFGWTPMFNATVRGVLTGSALGGASNSASYVTLATDTGLTSERVLTAGTGLLLTDAGAGSTVTLGVKNSVVATLSGSNFTGNVSFATGLTGSLQKTFGGLSYLMGTGGISITSMSNGQILLSGSAGSGGGGSFTAAGDLGGSSSSQTVLALTGVTGSFDIRSTAAILMWNSGSAAPTLKQQNNPTNSATAATLTIQAANAVGTSSTGGSLALSSGTGTTASGSVKLQTGGTDRVTVSPTTITVNPVHTDVTGNSKCTLRSDVANVQTTGATQTTLYSWTIGNNAMTTVDVTVTACVSAASNVTGGAVLKKSMSFRRNNGSTVTAIGSNVDGGSVADTALNSIAVVIDNSTTTGRVRVTGLSSTTIQWGVNVAIQELIQ